MAPTIEGHATHHKQVIVQEEPQPQNPSAVEPLSEQQRERARSRWKVIRLALNSSNKIGRRRIHKSNRIGETLRGSGLYEEMLASAIQIGIVKLIRGGTEVQGADGHRRVQFTLEDEVTYVMEEFAGGLFQSIRRAFGIDQNEYEAVLTKPPNATTNMQFIGVHSAAGKSAAWFLVSAGQRYMIKTCSRYEANLLLAILPAYLNRIKEEPASLLPRYYDICSICTGGVSTYFVVMGNIFAAHFPIRLRFDVKGSTQGRRASEKEHAKGDKAILKDLDLLERGVPFVLEGGDDQCHKLLEVIKSDCKWLAAHRLIDYSLLIGLACRPKKSAVPLSRHTIRTLALVPECEGEANLMYLGIIDILTTYMCRKVVEARCGTCILGDTSCKPPEVYADRFMKFAQHILSGSRRYSSESEDFEKVWLERPGRPCSIAGCLSIGKKQKPKRKIPETPDDTPRSSPSVRSVGTSVAGPGTSSKSAGNATGKASVLDAVRDELHYRIGPTEEAPIDVILRRTESNKEDLVCRDGEPSKEANNEAWSSKKETSHDVPLSKKETSHDVVPAVPNDRPCPPTSNYPTIIGKDSIENTTRVEYTNDGKMRIFTEL